MHCPLYNQEDQDQDFDLCIMFKIFADHTSDLGRQIQEAKRFFAGRHCRNSKQRAMESLHSCGQEKSQARSHILLDCVGRIR
jgi:hypothetical protein